MVCRSDAVGACFRVLSADRLLPPVPQPLTVGVNPRPVVPFWRDSTSPVAPCSGPRLCAVLGRRYRAVEGCQAGGCSRLLTARTRHIPEGRPKPYRDPVAEYEPLPMTLEAFSDLQAVATTYMAGQVIDLRLDGVDARGASRAVDWISGLVFGTSGQMKRIDHLRLRLSPRGTFTSS